MERDDNPFPIKGVSVHRTNTDRSNSSRKLQATAETYTSHLFRSYLRGTEILADSKNNIENKKWISFVLPGDTV